MSEKPPPFIALSYNFHADQPFAAALSRELIRREVPIWFLDHMADPQSVATDELLGGKVDWRVFSTNWQAVFIERLLSAHGAIVILSPSALVSHSDAGRGMWKERPAIDFMRKDNRLRVREIDRPNDDANIIPEELLEDLVGWGKLVLALPPVRRSAMASVDALEFNVPTGKTGPWQLPVRKPPADAWCELVRLDLYDVEWHCRSCGLSSSGYVMAEYEPPPCCPRCGFARQQ